MITKENIMKKSFFILAWFLFIQFISLDENLLFADQINVDSTLIEQSIKFANKEMEIESKRTANSRTWINSDKTMTIELCSGPMFSKSEGKWEPMNLRVHAATDTGWYVMDQADFKSKFKTTYSSENTVEFYPSHKKDVFFKSNIQSMGYYNQKTQSFHFLEKCREPRAMVNKDSVTYAHIFNGIDLLYTHNPFGLKEEIIVSPERKLELPAPKSLGWESNDTFLAFIIQYEIPQNIVAFAEKKTNFLSKCERN
jgi:hypothetical protein